MRSFTFYEVLSRAAACTGEIYENFANKEDGYGAKYDINVRFFVIKIVYGHDYNYKCVFFASAISL